jgi:hypothetical protein
MASRPVATTTPNERRLASSYGRAPHESRRQKIPRHSRIRAYIGLLLRSCAGEDPARRDTKDMGTALGRNLAQCGPPDPRLPPRR